MSRQLRSLKFISDTYCWRSAFTSNLKALSIAFLLVFLSSGSMMSQCQFQADIEGPADVTVECGSDLNNTDIVGLPTFLLYVDCDDIITLSFNDEVISSDGCTTVYSRTWIASVTLLGLVLDATVQTITVVDTQGPVISGVQPVIELQCASLPEPDAATAVDECGSSTPVTVFTSQTGEPVSSCCLTTAYGPGSDWSIWLPLLSSGGCCFNSANWVFDGCGHLDQYADGTAHIHGTVHNSSDPAQQFVVSLWLKSKRDWAAWSALGRGYRDDMGFGAATHFDWSYWELVNGFSTLTGAGSLAGDVLYLSHSPASYYFGFQAGQGANNRNNNNGLYGSFTYTGTIGGNGVCCQHGDLNVDMSNCTEVGDNDCVHSTSFTRFYRAMDSCGNVSTISQEININDTTIPVFVNCPESITIQCNEEIPAIAQGVTATDNCTPQDDVVIVYLGEEENVVSNCYRTITRGWSATDECGNVAVCEQVITIVDTTAPTLNGLPDAEVTVECTDVPDAPEVTVTDNCDMNVTVSFNEEVVEGNCASNYTIIRTWTSTDNCQNVATFTQTINVQDTTAPVFDQYQIYIHAECDDEIGPLTATDNCGDVTVTLIYECYLAGGCLGMHYRIYEAVDECGNVSTAEHFIAIQDHTAPEFQNVPADETIECSEVSVGDDGNYFDDGGVYAIDNCGYHFYLECLLPIEYTYEEEVVATDDDCPQSFDIIRTWTATDYCGNVAEASQIVHVVDTTAPVLWIPADYTASCEDELVYEDATAEDNCGSATVSVVVETIPGDCPNNYSITRTFTAEDECGNISEPQVQTITVVDETAPVFGDSVVEFVYECDEVIPSNQPVAADNCSELIEYAYSDTNSWTEGCYSGFTRIWTATDECGNVAYLYQYYSIEDTTAPVITGALEITRPCDDYAGIYVEATDNCNDFEITIEAEENVSGSCAGTVIRHYVATDVCGNVSEEFIQIIHLTDEVAPVIVSETEDFTVECGDEYVVIPATFEDNCDEELEITSEVTSDTDGCTTWVTYTWTATDHCDNSITSTTVVTIVDTTNPYFENFPANVTINCHDELPEVVYPEAYDTCDESVDVLYEPTTVPGDCPNEWVIYRVFRAFDDCGNQVVETQVITVIDEIAPVFGDSVVEFSYECDEVVPSNQPVATDNCSELIEYAYSDTNSWVDGCYSGFTRVWTATDECGNVAYLYQYYSIEDTTAPVITGAYELTLPCDDYSGIYVTATDNCNEFEIEIVAEENVSGACAGTIIRHYVATDVCGNASSEFIQIIHLTDDVAPVASIEPEDATYECNEEWAPAEVSFTDNCDDELEVTATSSVSQDGCTYVYTYVWTAVDHCDNTTVVNQVITVTDTTAPTASFEPEDFTVECSDEWSVIAPEFWDNCDQELTLDNGSSEESDGCTTWVTFWWSATDNCDNTTLVNQVVTIVDTTAPVIVTPNGGEFSCDEDIVYGEASVSDNCDDDVALSFVDETVAGDCPQSYSIVRTWTAVDNCDNVATASVTYWIYDNEAPEFTSVPENVTIECSDALPTDQASAVDNCGEVSISVNDVWEVQGDCYSVLIRTWTAVDECDNYNYASQVITIVDTTAPVITGTIEVSMPCDDVETEIHESIVATDNCDLDVEVVIYNDEHVSGGCAGKIIRTYRAYDNCQNWSEFVQFITLTDNVAPVASIEPEDFTVECGQDWSPASVTFTDNCDDNLTLLPDVFVATDGCTTTYTYIWLAVDHCDNATTVDQVITIVDTTAPVIDSEDSETTVACNIIVDFVAPTATDNCDEDVEIIPSYSSTPGDCPGEYTEVYTFTAVDNCGNTSAVHYTVHHVDNVAPVLENIPSSNEYSCDEIVPLVLPTATDLCSEATVHHSEDVIPGQCPNSYVLVRTFWATDECGNESEGISVSYYIYDNQAPTFDSEPSNESYECLDWASYSTQVLTASDNCGTASVNAVIIPVSSDDCGNGVWQVLYTATDECWNSDTISYYISIEDVTAPELSEYPSNLVIDCGTELPAAPEVTAADNCTEFVEVSMTETCLSGDCPEVGETPACQLKTPVRPANNPCVYPYDWAMALFGMPNAYKYYQLVEGSATMTNNGDGTLTLTGRLVNAVDPTSGFDFNVTFGNELDWAGWSSQSFPTGFKGDCGGIGANHEDWVYYILQNTNGYELTGWGGYAGSQINLTHAPANNYFGFQLGVGANNYNGANGFGGWFNYSGNFNGGMVTGAGDFAFEIDCCIEYDLQRCWTAMDCSGNEVSWCQVISYRDLDTDMNGGNNGGDMVLNGGSQQVAIVSMAPNPTSNNSQISFTSTESERLSLQVLDMTGRVVADLFNSDVVGGVVYKVDFNANALQAGIYMMRLNSKSETDIERIQVVR